MKAVRHVGIVVADLEKALHFYRDLLGLKIVKKMNEQGDYIDRISGLLNVKITTIKMAAEDENMIELLYYHSHPRKTNNKKDICEVGFSHVAFTVENIDEEYRKLLNAGVQFNAPPQVSDDGYAKVTFCKDSDNNLVELVEIL